MMLSTMRIGGWYTVQRIVRCTTAESVMPYLKLKSTQTIYHVGSDHARMAMKASTPANRRGASVDGSATEYNLLISSAGRFRLSRLNNRRDRGRGRSGLPVGRRYSIK